MTGKGIDLLEPYERKEQVTGRNEMTGKSQLLVGVKWQERASDWSEVTWQGRAITYLSQMTGKSNWLVGKTEKIND
jgi:hypothetical protein